MQLISDIVIAIISAIWVFHISQSLIEKVLDKILTDIKKLDSKSAESVETRSKELGYIVKIVACIEYLFFGALSFWFFRDGQITDSEIGSFFTFFAGWLAIKMIPSYQLWSHEIVGKAYFYRSLFGTIISIVFAIFFGVIIVRIFIQ